MRAHVTGLVPLRALGIGKSRLATQLSADQRATLARAMFEDVATALAASPVDEVVVAAGDAHAAALAGELGLRAEIDGPGVSTLDAAVAGAVATLDTTGSVLVLAADLPRVTPDDIAAVLAAEGAVVIAPTYDGGTAALLRRPADVIATAYGPRSAARHAALAQQRGVRVAEVRTSGLRHDVDTWADLIALRPAEVGRHTAAVLTELTSTIPARR